jgi:hypothetical protein
MSARGERVLYPTFVVALVTFVSFGVHLVLLGTSSFPTGGRLVDGKYIFQDHGRTIRLTEWDYWFSYIHGVVMVAVLAMTAGLVILCYCRGDLRDEYQDRRR